MTTKPNDVINREAEWGALGALWRRDRPELAFVVGRRRVGKSYVLARFARAVGGIYYQATRRTEAEQLASLSRIIGEHFGDVALRQGVGFPTWEALFTYLAERTGNGPNDAKGLPLLLVLDEFPYLADAASALPSILQAAWDHRWAPSRIKLVLSGSYITAMERLEATDQPLYGRRTARLAFAPFTVADVGAFVPGYAARDQLRAYGLFGHLPGNLALLDPQASLDENAAFLLLDPASRLVDDAQHILDAFLGEAGVHYSILEAIATGEQTWSGITKRVGRSGGAFLRPLQWLEGMGLVERAVPITEKKPARSKRALYRITDPYIAFWHRVIAPLLRAGSIGLVSPEVLWREAVATRLDDHMSPVFEMACRDVVRRAGRLPFQPLRVGEWWDARSQDQADVVAIGGDGELFVGECKWGPVTRRHLADLQRRARRVAAELEGIRRTYLALFTGRSDVEEAIQAAVDAGEMLLFTADDLVQA